MKFCICSSEMGLKTCKSIDKKSWRWKDMQKKNKFNKEICSI